MAIEALAWKLQRTSGSSISTRPVSETAKCSFFFPTFLPRKQNKRTSKSSLGKIPALYTHNWWRLISPLQMFCFFPKQLWSWMGFSILPRNRLCSIIISGFRVGFRGLSSYSFGIRFHHLFWFRVGFRGLSRWFRVGFRGLSPYPFGILFHHPFLVPARLPPVPSSFPGPG